MKKILLLLMMLCSIFIFTGCGKKDIAMTFAIGDAQISLNDTLQSIYDQDLVLCEVDGTVLKEEDLPELKGKIIDSESYCIGKKTDKESIAEPTHLYVYLYNTSLLSTPLKDCKNYQFLYNVPEDRDTAEVLINGVNFAQLTDEEAVAKLEEMGLSYEQEDKDKFLSTENGYFLKTSTNNCLYSINSDVVYNRPSEEEMEQIMQSARDADGFIDSEKYRELIDEAEEEQVVITEFKLQKILNVQYD